MARDERLSAVWTRAIREYETDPTRPYRRAPQAWYERRDEVRREERAEQERLREILRKAFGPNSY